MEGSIGLLSNNSEIIEEFKVNIPSFRLRNYRSVDSINPGEIIILAVDVDFFDSRDVIQFYLSRIRKKLQIIPVLLILRIKFLSNIDIEWFFEEFILYPFRKGELLVRLNRFIRESSSFDNENIISIGSIKINLKEYSVYLRNIKLELTFKEFELLRYLVQNTGVVYSRKELLGKIWGTEYVGGTRTVDVHIRRLRVKLGNEFNSIIETVRNVGYRCREF
ncbi:MAG: response regulator transcription factor [Spirochaetota bacterium]|nr:response regulator transcription factor [Spirochaetota bacterium]